MDTLKYSEILQLNRIMFQEVKGTPYRVKLLTNITVNSIKELLEYVLHVNQINPLVEIGNYDNIIQDSAKCEDSDLVIVFYNTHNIINNLSSFFEGIDEEMYDSIKEKIYSEIDIVFENLKNCPSVIFNQFSSKEFVTSYFHKSKIEHLVLDLNKYLETKKTINVNLVDLDKIVGKIGIHQSIDFRLYHSSKAPYTLTFLKNYVAAIEPIILRNTGKLKKVIIFDCDNTLWKGILGEDGPDKIDMSRTSHDGRIFNSIQQIAVFLSKRGVIVGICSKNNELDVSELLENHPDIILKDNFIAIKKVNWKDKVTNLKSIALELNVGIDSIVFVDDSSFEIDFVKEQLPEIVTLQVPTVLYEYPNELLKFAYKYFNLLINRDDENKTEIYKQQFVRESFKNKFKTVDEYLASLKIALTIFKDEKSLIPRIAQLTQKTNQFNLTTKRYTENQIFSFIESERNHVFAVSVEDKFGDNGITGLCILTSDLQNSENITIDTFLMSCRIIGRNIEFAFMDYIIDWLIINQYHVINAEYIKTKKNEQVADFYDRLGFRLISNNGDIKAYSMKLSEYNENKIEYINVITKINASN